MEYKYLLIQPNEDGNPMIFLNEERLQDLLNEPEEYSVKCFLEQIPDNNNPQYWGEGNVLLLKIEILVPKTKSVAFRLDDE